MQQLLKPYQLLNKKAFLRLIFLLAILINVADFPVSAQVSVAASDTIQSDSVNINKARLRTLGIGFGVAYTGMIVALNEAWYEDMDRTGFHFFNDNHEWKQVDKAGHFWGAFHESRAGIDMLRWAGVPEKKSDFVWRPDGYSFTNTSGDFRWISG